MHELTPITQQMTQTAVTKPPSANIPQQSPVQAVNDALTTPAAEVPRETKQTPEMDQKFAALTRKEKELLRQRRELQQKEKELLEKSSRYKPFEEAQELAKHSKLKALEKMGFTYDELTNEFLGQSNQSPEQMAESKAREIVSRELQAYKDEQATLQKQLHEQTINQARQQISTEARALAAESQEFPLVNKIKGFDTISQYVEQTFYETGEVMSVEAATKEYEAFLENEILEVANTDKIRTKLLGNQETKPPAPQTLVNQQPKTLTNKATAAPVSSKPKSYEEKKREIIQKYWNAAT